MNNAVFNNIMELVEKLKLELSYLPLKGKDYIEALYIYKPSTKTGNFVNIFFYKDGKTNVVFWYEDENEHKDYTYSLFETIENPSYLDLLLKFNYYL